jgi:hypothetical protein
VYGRHLPEPVSSSGRSSDRGAWPAAGPRVSVASEYDTQRLTERRCYDNPVRGLRQVVSSGRPSVDFADGRLPAFTHRDQILR